MSATSQMFRPSSDACSWGRVERVPREVATIAFADEIAGLFPSAPGGSLLGTGLRRSYGDSCLNTAGGAVDLTGLDRFIAFDPTNGRLRAEAGISLDAVLRMTVPHGWFLPTTPGTRFVTLGGAVANDVHGKNHHRAGTFGSSVHAIGLRRSDVGRVVLTKEGSDPLFAATVGGLGLTGIIEWVEFDLARIPSAALDVETCPFGHVDDFFDIAADSTSRFEHTVAWIDCLARGHRLGRGAFFRANWSPEGEFAPHRGGPSIALPFDLPDRMLNRVTVSAFNALYAAANGRQRVKRRHYSNVFYPLDGIGHWNRLYGRSGMLQYQCVVPFEASRDAIRALLEGISRSGQGSFLAVLKTFGDRPSPGQLSFPRPGATLALDVPMRGRETLALLSRLDAIVADAGGALYPAKDGRMSAEMFRRSFPKWEAFDALRDRRMNSDFWRRVAS